MLKLAPSTPHLQRIYFELAKFGARAVGKNKSWPFKYTELEDLFVLAAALSRYDPRLFHILVDFSYHHWQKLNPLKLRSYLSQSQAPACVAVILNFVAQGAGDTEFVYFFEYVTRDIKPVAPQLYFFGLHLPASVMQQRVFLEGLKEFSDWGFLAREKPIVYLSDGRRLELGHLSYDARTATARHLAQKKGSFSLADYLDAIHHAVSRQQAALDLKKCGEFKLKGKGRGCEWVLA